MATILCRYDFKYYDEAEFLGAIVGDEATPVRIHRRKPLHTEDGRPVVRTASGGYETTSVSFPQPARAAVSLPGANVAPPPAEEDR